MNWNVYTREELIRACRTLIGKHTDLNHTAEILQEVQTVDADYEDDTVECLDRVLKGSKALSMLEKGEILQVSIEADCLRGSMLTPEGWTCEGLVFTGKAYLTKDVLPGVPLTRIMPVEKLVESFKGITMQKEEIEQKAETKDLISGKEAKAQNVLVAAAKDAGVGDSEVLEKIEDLQGKYEALKSELEQLKKPKEEPKQEPKKEPCKCLLTKEGFWARFHQLRSEGASKSEAFRLVSMEVIEAVNKQK
jgi:hypothetical protein